MNRGINLFVFLMSCVIFGVSILIGFKAFNDIDAANKPIPQETTHPLTVNQPNTPVNTITNPHPNTSINTTTIANPSTTSTPILPINKKARIDQQKLYMVIAGGFHNVTNAESHQLQLKQLGYDAEVIRFKNSRLHVVCAGKFHNSKSANKLVHTLQQSHRIEAYVQVPI